MSVLDNIVRMIGLEKQEDQVRQQTMTSALDMLSRMGQAQEQIQVEKQKLDVDLATKGLRFGDGGEIEGAPDLINQLQQDVFIATGEGGLQNIGSVPKSAKVFKGKEPKEEKTFDAVTTEEVFTKLVSPKNDEDFEADLKDLKSNRKLYEDMGVDVVDIMKRAMNRQPAAKKSKWRKFLDFAL